MPDPLDNVTPGEVSPFVTSAATANAVLDAVRRIRAAKGPGVSSPGVSNDPLTPACLVLVKNNSGSTVPEWGVLTPSGMEIDPAADEATGFAARRKPVFVGTAPAADDDPVLIPVEPIANGVIGRAAIAGCTVAMVYRTSSSHEFAVPVAANKTSLASAESGPVRLLAPGSVTGTQKFYVRLGDGVGEAAAPTPYGASTALSDYNVTAGTWQATGHKVTLPAAGTYVIRYQVRAIGVSYTVGDQIACKLRNNTTAADLSPLWTAITIVVAVTHHECVCGGSVIYTAAGAEEVEIYATQAGASFTDCRIGGGVPPALNYHRIV